MPVTFSDAQFEKLKEMIEFVPWLDYGTKLHGEFQALIDEVSPTVAPVEPAEEPKVNRRKLAEQTVVVRENQYTNDVLKNTTRYQTKVYHDNTGYFVWQGHRRRYLSVTKKGNFVLRRDFKGGSEIF